jgi:hypothetical protein
MRDVQLVLDKFGLWEVLCTKLQIFHGNIFKDGPLLPDFQKLRDGSHDGIFGPINAGFWLVSNLVCKTSCTRCREIWIAPWDRFMVTTKTLLPRPNAGTKCHNVTLFLYFFQVFNSVNIWCYRILSLVCAIPAMVLWGCNFACLAFCTVWCCAPCMKCFEIHLKFVQTIWTTLITAFCEPCYLAVGKVFYNIRITMQNKSQ